MRSAYQAVVFAFTWTLLNGTGGWLCDTAYAAADNFLLDCNTIEASSAQAHPQGAGHNVVIGRRGSDANALVAAVGQRGVYETRDRGETWDLLTPPGSCHRPVKAFWDNPPDGDRICLTTPVGQQPHNTYCTPDRGRTWEAQGWIRDADQVMFDPSDPSRAFGSTPTNHCNLVCAGPTFGIAMAHAKSLDRLCACNLRLSHASGGNPRLYALRDTDDSGQNQLVSLSRDMERENLLIRQSDPNVRMIDVYTNPLSDQSFLVTIAKRMPLGQETGLCCDSLYETINGGRTHRTVPLLFGPLESVQFISPYGDIAAVVHTPHLPAGAYIATKTFGSVDWTWTRAPEPHGKILAVGNTLYFAGKHLYRVNTSPYAVIDPVY